MELPNNERLGGPLAGVRVIDLTVNVLGPVATQILGDMGADVIKVETPAGDPNRDTGPRRNARMSAMHLNMNRNKRSVTLDLKCAGGREALMRLVETADVFVHSMRPAAAKRLGVGYDVISARNPRIIYGYGPGYRQDGPNRDYPAYDDVVQGESGIAALMAQVNGSGPRFYPTVIIDKLCGYVLASSDRHGALRARALGAGTGSPRADVRDDPRVQLSRAPVGRRFRSAAGARHRLRAAAHADTASRTRRTMATSACSR